MFQSLLKFRWKTSRKDYLLTKTNLVYREQSHDGLCYSFQALFLDALAYLEVPLCHSVTH